MKYPFKMAVLLLLASCHTSKKNCDAYGYRYVGDYEYIQVVGYTDTVPTYGSPFIHLPKGEYRVKAWSNGEEITMRVKL